MQQRVVSWFTGYLGCNLGVGPSCCALAGWRGLGGSDGRGADVGWERAARDFGRHRALHSKIWDTWPRCDGAREQVGDATRAGEGNTARGQVRNGSGGQIGEGARAEVDRRGLTWQPADLTHTSIPLSWSTLGICNIHLMLCCHPHPWRSV